MSWIEDPGADEFEGLDLTRLDVDQAYLRVESSADNLWLYTLSDECYKCPYVRRLELSSVLPGEAVTYRTTFSESWRIYPDGAPDTVPADNDTGSLCELTSRLGEFGVYDLTVGGSGAGPSQCILTTAREPVNIYLPILLWFLVLLTGTVLWVAFSWGRGRLKDRAKNRQVVPTSQLDDSSSVPEVPTPPARQRLKSLDTFRGIAIVLMIFVNYGAGHYWEFEHAVWNGLKMADLLFPWFMWIMGACIPISIKSQLKKNVPRLRIFTAVLRRSCILFLLGLVLATKGVGARLETIRLFGVLQRFGVAYLAVGTLGLVLTRREYEKPQHKVAACLQDVIVLLPQWAVILGVIAGHTLITFLLPVPGCPTGYLGPGGIQDGGEYKTCIGGATGFVDRLVLGERHLYQYPTADEIYGSGPFDPEGVLGCMTSVVQVFLGVQAGWILLLHQSVTARVARWAAWGVATGLLGALLCLASKEDGWIPVNKNLWSLSFVLVTSCFAFFLLSACYVLIDVKDWWSGAPFFYPGMNSTILYVGHSLCGELFPWHWAYGPMNTHFLRLSECLWGTALWVVVAVWLFRINFFLSI